jgi:hypothetical protein
MALTTRPAAQCQLVADLAAQAAPFRLPLTFIRTIAAVAPVGAVAAAARLIQLTYDLPPPPVTVIRDLRTEGGAMTLTTPCPGEARDIVDRVKLLTGIARWGAKSSFGQYGLIPTVGPAIVTVLSKPMPSAGGGEMDDWRNQAVYAAAQVVLDSKDSSLDALTWLLLWQWAVGGPNGNASPRTRVLAMKAIQAVLRRKALLPGQIRAANSLAAVLQQLVVARAPQVSAAERDWFLSEADATVGAVASAQFEVESAGYFPDVNTPALPAAVMPSWIPVAAAAGASLALVGGAVLIAARRLRGVKAS